MPTLCRAFSTDEEAHAAVDRLLAAGMPDAEIRLLMGRPVRDHRDDTVGGFAGRSGDEPVGSFADIPRSSREAVGSFAGDADQQRRGGFGDLDRETVTSYHEGVPRIHVASHRDLKKLLVEAGLDGADADADVAALHHGRILVLVRTSTLNPEAAVEALDRPVSV
jgi:hypothetical protein